MESLDSIFGPEDNTHTQLDDPTVTSIVLMNVILNRRMLLECCHDDAEYDDFERVVYAMAFTQNIWKMLLISSTAVSLSICQVPEFSTVQGVKCS